MSNFVCSRLCLRRKTTIGEAAEATSEATTALQFQYTLHKREKAKPFMPNAILSILAFGKLSKKEKEL